MKRIKDILIGDSFYFKLYLFALKYLLALLEAVEYFTKKNSILSVVIKFYQTLYDIFVIYCLQFIFKSIFR